MKKIWFLFYNVLVIPALFIIFQIAGLFNEKIKQGIKDRKNLFSKLERDLNNIDRNKKLLWFHSASMGEFEQAKPIIEKFKSEHDVNILVTFFSPSGYRNSVNYKYKDVISYIPFDSYGNIKKFINLVKPDVMIFMRYDFWPNLVWLLQKSSVPSYIVDATMRWNSKRKLPLVKAFHKSLFKNFGKILTVSESDAENFIDLGVEKSKVFAVGDTRYDRVYQKCIQAKSLQIIKEGLLKDKKVFVFGSSWPSDEEVMLPALLKLYENENNIRIILVPHEPTINRLEKLEEKFNGSYSHIRFSHLNRYNNEQIILVDSIGILVSLYHYADVAYVGGSFKQGIHNVLEAAVYGIPVMFGPKIENSQEAMHLAKIGGGIKITNIEEADKALKTLFFNENERIRIGKVNHDYVYNHIGATEKIIKEIASVI